MFDVGDSFLPLFAAVVFFLLGGVLEGGEREDRRRAGSECCDYKSNFAGFQGLQEGTKTGHLQDEE